MRNSQLTNLFLHQNTALTMSSLIDQLVWKLESTVVLDDGKRRKRGGGSVSTNFSSGSLDDLTDTCSTTSSSSESSSDYDSCTDAGSEEEDDIEEVEQNLQKRCRRVLDDIFEGLDFSDSSLMGMACKSQKEFGNLSTANHYPLSEPMAMTTPFVFTFPFSAALDNLSQ